MAGRVEDGHIEDGIVEDGHVEDGQDGDGDDTFARNPIEKLLSVYRVMQDPKVRISSKHDQHQ